MGSSSNRGCGGNSWFNGHSQQNNCHRSSQPGRSGNYRGRGRGRGPPLGQSTHPMCQVCNRVWHTANTCYHRFNHTFQGNSYPFPSNLPSSESSNINTASNLHSPSHSSSATATSTSCSSQCLHTAPPLTHPMLTRLQDNILLLKQFHDGTVKYLVPKALFVAASLDETEPTYFTKVSEFLTWRLAMNEEFTDLMKNGTWDLVPLT